MTSGNRSSSPRTWYPRQLYPTGLKVSMIPAIRNLFSRSTASMMTRAWPDDPITTMLYMSQVHPSGDWRAFLGETDREVGGLKLCGSLGFRVKKVVVNAVNLADRKSTRLNSSHLGISYAVF